MTTMFGRFFVGSWARACAEPKRSPIVERRMAIRGAFTMSLRGVRSERFEDDRLTDAAKGSHGLDLLAGVAVGEADRVEPLRFDHAGIDRVDANLPGPQLLGERSGRRIDGSLGRAVGRGAREAERRDDRADV